MNNFDEEYAHALKMYRNWDRVEEYDAELDHWHKPRYSSICYTPDVLNKPQHFRLKPDAKYVPLTRDDMPVSFVIRVLGERSRDHYYPNKVTENYLQYADGSRRTWQTLFEDPQLQYSTDRKTWLPFRKEATV